MTKHAAEQSDTQRLGSSPMPKVSPVLLGGFQWYLKRLIRKSFNGVRIAKGTRPQLAPDQSVVCFVNHPGWWDPLFVFLLNRACLHPRKAYVPIDHRSLEKYPVFRRLGFFGIEMNRVDGARQFLSVTRQLLSQPDAAIWITPSGRFDDVRTRTTIQPGLPHLAKSISDACLLPVAFEYPFWDERTPEALVEFGAPIWPKEYELPKSQWKLLLEDQLAEVQGRLAAKAIARDFDAFDTLVDGAAGVGGSYDFFRRTRALLRRQTFDARHRQRKRSAA